MLGYIWLIELTNLAKLIARKAVSRMDSNPLPYLTIQPILVTGCMLPDA